jgi:hypothetical protein
LIYQVDLKRDSDNTYPGLIEICKEGDEIVFVLSNPTRVIKISYFDFLTITSGIKLREELTRYEENKNETI